MKLAVLFHRLGPYHHARLRALVGQAELTAIEFSRVDNTYAWDIVSADDTYPVVSLFTDADIETKPVGSIVTRMQTTLDKLRPHVVALPGWSSRASLAALAWCCMTRTPAILMSDSTADDERRTWWKEWIKSRVVRLFPAALVAGTPHVDYVAALGMPRARAFAGYDVVDNAYFAVEADKVRSDSSTHRKRHGLPEHYFLASSRFIEKKNLARLLDAYAAYVLRTGESAWGLVMLGDGPLRTELMGQVIRQGLTQRVQFPGFRQYDELPVFYGLANAFIQASTTEQWGLVVNEAMACGLPVLVSNRCGCAPDLVKGGINGFSFDPYDIDSITDRMLQISGGGADRAGMGQASREIIQGWSPRTFAASMLKAAGAALACPRPQAGWLERALLWGLMRR